VPMLTRAPASGGGGGGGGARVLHRPFLSAAMHAARAGAKSSSYKGVSKTASEWVAQLYDPQTKSRHYIGLYDSEEDAARAYDCAAVKLRGPGNAKRNFPGEVISEPLVSLGDKMRERKTSRFTGVSWHKSNRVWHAYLRNPQTKRRQHIGSYDSETSAAMAYDCVAVELHGPDWPNRNFPGELITKPPASRGDEQRRLKALR
jgi:hypothetical protein